MRATLTQGAASVTAAEGMGSLCRLQGSDPGLYRCSRARPAPAPAVPSETQGQDTQPGILRALHTPWP